MATASSVAAAQTPAQPTENVVEEIVITGTSIRGVAPVGAVPTLFQREAIQERAPLSVSDALSNVPQMTNFGTEQQSSTTNRFRTAGYIPVIHNMEIGSTLTLINGHRVAAVGAEAVFPDPDIIPTVALERVEIVADGNSAVYGSDAVAGVVNFTYRRAFDGFQVQGATTWDPSTSFGRKRGGIVFGKTFDSGDFMLAYERAEQTGARSAEIPFIADGDQSKRGLTDRRGTVCFEPNIVFGGRTYSGPNLTTGTYRCNTVIPGQILGRDSERDSALATGRWRPVEGVELTAELNYSAYSDETYGGYGNIDVNIPSTSPFFKVPPGANPAGVTTERVRMNSFPLYGGRPQLSWYKFYGATLGSRIDLPSDWQANIRGHYSWSTNEWGAGVIGGGLDPQNLQTLATAGRFNPFGPNDPAVTAQIVNGYGIYNYGKQGLFELEAKADGPLFSLPGGEVRAAIGINHRTEYLRQIQEQGCETTSCSFFIRQRDDDMARGVNSGFVELSIPLIGESNAMPGFQELTLSAAGRYDKYDLLEGVFTPKVGAVWKPIRGISLHGSWGKSFAAPNIGYLTNTFGIVQLGANVQGTVFDIYNMGGGNPDLTPERAKTYSFGADFQPDAIPGLSFGASYYNVAYRNLVYKPGRAEVIFNPAFSSARIVGDESRPTTPVVIPNSLLGAVIAQAPPDRPLGTQTFTLVHRSYAINLGSRNFAGLDVYARYQFDTSIGRWGGSLNGNRQLTRETQVLAGGPFTDEIGSRTAPKWQVTGQVFWEGETIPLRLAWDTNYMSGYDDRFGSACCKIKPLYRHNFSATYNIESLLQGATLQLRITNLFDDEPPKYDTDVGYDAQNATPYGRQFTATVTARF